jgi:hypothetical protein
LKTFEEIITLTQYGDGGYEQLVSNGGRFKPALDERDKKQTMIDLRGISTNPSLGFLGSGLCM